MECSQKADLEKACLEEAGQRFTQAHQAPLLTPPLIYQLGKCGKPKTISKVVEGTILTPAGCNPYAAQFLAAVTRWPGIQDTTQRTVIKYSKGWQKAQETTGSSALGIHFGHYMTGMFNPTFCSSTPQWLIYHFEWVSHTTDGRSA